jgi:hypothetical protein
VKGTRRKVRQTAGSEVHIVVDQRKASKRARAHHHQGEADKGGKHILVTFHTFDRRGRNKAPMETTFLWF